MVAVGRILPTGFKSCRFLLPKRFPKKDLGFGKKSWDRGVGIERPAVSDSVSTNKQIQQLEPWSKKALRHGVSVKTLSRWQARGIIDPPVVINKRRYSDASEEPRRDTENV